MEMPSRDIVRSRRLNLRRDDIRALCLGLFESIDLRGTSLIGARATFFDSKSQTVSRAVLRKSYS
jgi:hypothetical protein